MMRGWGREGGTCFAFVAVDQHRVVAAVQNHSEGGYNLLVGDWGQSCQSWVCECGTSDVL